MRQKSSSAIRLWTGTVRALGVNCTEGSDSSSSRSNNGLQEERRSPPEKRCCLLGLIL